MDFANPYAVIDIPLLELLRNLGVGLILAVIWALVISRSTRLVVDHHQYLPMFLLLIPAMIIIISIIKSSIALSLGLVGALSIVRFRTPIKEPEELLYIFVAIAVGLGLGANQVMVTVVGFAVIVAVLIPFAMTRKRLRGNKANLLDIVVRDKDGDTGFAAIENLMHSQDMTWKVRRLYRNGDRLEILVETLGIQLAEVDALRTELARLGTEVEISVTSNARIIT